MPGAKSPEGKGILACRRAKEMKICPLFTARCSYASVVLGIVILSVCQSVTCILCDKTKQCTADVLVQHEMAITLVF